MGKLELRRRIKLNNIFPILTIIAAGTAILISILDIKEASFAETIIITLLGLIAIDALSERISILQKIIKRLNSRSSEHEAPCLSSRNKIIPLNICGESSSEISIVAVSALSIGHKYHKFLKDKIINGCDVKIILLHPFCESIKIHGQQYGFETALSDLDATIRFIIPLLQLKNCKGSCDLRFLNVLLPFSICALDISKPYGSVSVEYHSYKTTFEENPHIKLSLSNDSKWYSFYKDQYNVALENSIRYDEDPRILKKYFKGVKGL